MNKQLILLACIAVLLTTGCATHRSLPPDVERKQYGPWESEIGFSQAVKVGNTLYISGVTSQKESFDEQLIDVYTAIQRILSDFKVTTDAVVKEVIYTTDLDALQRAIPLRKTYFQNSYPSATWVQVERLFLPSMKIEVEVVAHIPPANPVRP